MCRRSYMLRLPGRPPVPPSYEFSMKRFVLLAVVCLGAVFVGSLSAVRSYRQFADTDRVETAQLIACWLSGVMPACRWRRIIRNQGKR